MIVCVCHRVSDRDIAHAARAGCETFDELQDELRVGTGCGACLDCARECLEAHRTQVTEAPRQWLMRVESVAAVEAVPA